QSAVGNWPFLSHTVIKIIPQRRRETVEASEDFSGRRTRDRTWDLGLVRAALFQLSYPPGASQTLVILAPPGRERERRSIARSSRVTRPSRGPSRPTSHPPGHG